VGLTGDGEMGERTMATGEGILRDSEGRVEVAVVEMERESLGLTAREASMVVGLCGLILLWCRRWTLINVRVQRWKLWFVGSQSKTTE